MVTLSDIRAAQALLRGIAVRTPLMEWTGGASDTRKLYLKLENLQPIGAFKLRGAYNKVASLTAAERRRGVISYSSGNHGQGVAYAARALGTKAIIVMPGNAPKNKLAATAVESLSPMVAFNLVQRVHERREGVRWPRQHTRANCRRGPVARPGASC